MVENWNFSRIFWSKIEFNLGWISKIRSLKISGNVFCNSREENLRKHFWWKIKIFAQNRHSWSMLVKIEIFGTIFGRTQNFGKWQFFAKNRNFAWRWEFFKKCFPKFWSKISIFEFKNFNFEIIQLEISVGFLSFRNSKIGNFVSTNQTFLIFFNSCSLSNVKTLTPAKAAALICEFGLQGLAKMSQSAARSRDWANSRSFFDWILKPQPDWRNRPMTSSEEFTFNEWNGFTRGRYRCQAIT